MDPTCCEIASFLVYYPKMSQMITLLKVFTFVAAYEVATRTVGSQSNSSVNYGSMNLFSDRNERNSRTTELSYKRGTFSHF